MAQLDSYQIADRVDAWIKSKGVHLVAMGGGGVEHITIHGIVLKVCEVLEEEMLIVLAREEEE